jgi:hypothetical protein
MRQISTMLLTLAVIGNSCAEEVAAHPAAPDHPLFKKCIVEEQVPQLLVQAYAAFVKETQEKVPDLSPCVLPGNGVQVSHEARKNGEKNHGSDLNLPFLTSDFVANVEVARKVGEDTWLVRTSSSALWFVHTHSDKWMICHYLDKPNRMSSATMSSSACRR